MLEKRGKQVQKQWLPKEPTRHEMEIGKCRLLQISRGNKKIDIFSFSSFFLILLIDSGEIQRTGNKGDYKQQQQDFTS